MAVAEDHAGQSVRCPHCHGVIAVPGGSDRIGPSLQPLTDTEQEQLFAALDRDREQKPEIPSPGERGYVRPAASETDWPATEEPAELGGWPGRALGHPSAMDSRPARRGRSWVVGLVIVPLISYAILATVIIVIQYLRLRSLSHGESTPTKPAAEYTGARP
jgi:hypothetical protein